MTSSRKDQPVNLAARRWAKRNKPLPADLKEALASAAGGIPCAVECDRLHELELMVERSGKEITTVDVSEELEVLLAAHGCDCSGPYLGDPESGMGDYYLFERRKAA